MRSEKSALSPDDADIDVTLKRRILGRTGLSVSELGFGCSSFWAKPVFPEEQARALLEQSIEGGINVFDTGPSYGAGHAERRLGALLGSLPHKADLVICSKAGTHVGADGKPFRDWSPQAVRASVHGSLERLGIDRLQILHLHGPAITDLTPPLLEALADLKREGLVAFVGINSFDGEVVRHGLKIPLFDSFMVEYNLIKKQNAGLLDEIAATGAGAMIGTPVAQALFREPTSMWPTSLKKAWELARALKNHRAELVAGRRYGFLNGLPDMTGAQAALAFVLREPKFGTAVFGTTSQSHLKENLEAAGMALPADILRRIQAGPDA